MEAHTRLADGQFPKDGNIRKIFANDNNNIYFAEQNPHTE